MKRTLLLLSVVAVLALGLVIQGYMHMTDAYAIDSKGSGIVYVSWHFFADSSSVSYPLDLSGIPAGPYPYAEVRFHIYSDGTPNGMFRFRHNQTNLWGAGYGFSGWTDWMYAKGGLNVDNILLDPGFGSGAAGVDSSSVHIDKYEYTTYFARAIPVDSLDAQR